MPSLREFFRSDAFVPTTAVFPPIDSSRLAGDLGLVTEGRARGGRGQPGEMETGFDAIENRVVEAVGDLRRKGLDTYGENVRVYDTRLARAVDAREAVEMAAQKARGDFQAAVAVWQARMANPAGHIELAIADLRRFRAEHGVGHVAVGASLLSWLLAALIVVLVESAANAFLFKDVMTSGWAGGMVIAAAISAVNAAIAALATYFGRNLNHRRWYWKLFGLAAAVIGIGLCLGFNLGVAHLRDALERGLELEPALAQSWATLWTTPLALGSFLSALLMLVGVVAAILVGLKTYHSIDPYPGYPAVFATVTNSRDTYARTLDEAIGDLDASRDAAIDDLRDANQEMRLWIREAVDALYGQSSLRSELDRFLAHCDDKANALLAVYRDANREARGTPPPGHFSDRFAFPEMLLPRPAEAARDDALAEQKRVSELVSAAIEAIHAAYRESVAAYPSIATLEAQIRGSAG